MEDNSFKRTWLDVPQLADYLGCSASCIYKRVSEKEIPFSKMIGRLRFNREDIDKWMREGGCMDSTRGKSVAGP